MTTSGTAKTLSIIAYGAFTAPGTDHLGKTADTLVFPGGSFKVTLFTSAGTGSINSMCLSTAGEHGTYSLSHGTGTFAGIRGHGTFTMSALAIERRVNGGCSQNAAPLAYQQLIRASGPVKLP